MELEVGILTTLVGWLITLLTSVKGFISNIKLKKKNKLIEQIDEWVIKAEEFVNYTGKEKLQTVLHYALRFCVDNKIKYVEEEVVEKVEKAIKTSKFVNARKKIIQGGENDVRGTARTSIDPAIAEQRIGRIEQQFGFRTREEHRENQ